TTVCMIGGPVFRFPSPCFRSRWSLRGRLFLPALLSLVPAFARAQGVTTGAVAGIVTNDAGAPLANVTIVATHVPSGTQYRALSRGSGAFTLPNVRVGGPYTLKTTLLGFEPGTRENLFVALGETQRVDFKLARAA